MVDQKITIRKYLGMEVSEPIKKEKTTIGFTGNFSPVYIILIDIQWESNL